MKKFKENFIPMLMMLSIPIIHVFYQLLNNSDRGVSSLVTGIDAMIPFEKAFIIPYIGWYVFIIVILAVLCFRDRNTYYTTLLAFNLTLAVSYLFYFLYQTTVPRPELTGNDLLTNMVAFIYAKDQPFNCFPSIHVSTSYLMIRAMNLSSLKSRLNVLAVKALAGLIIVSTLFVKQHVVLDVVGGIFLADIIFDLTYQYRLADQLSAWFRSAYATLIEKLDLETNE